MKLTSSRRRSRLSSSCCCPCSSLSCTGLHNRRLDQVRGPGKESGRSVAGGAAPYRTGDDHYQHLRRHPYAQWPAPPCHRRQPRTQTARNLDSSRWAEMMRCCSSLATPLSRASGGRTDACPDELAARCRGWLACW